MKIVRVKKFERAPYERYSFYFLKEILERELKELESWRNYKITKVDNGHYEYIIVGKTKFDKGNTELFFDLMVEYIRTGKYLEK